MTSAIVGRRRILVTAVAGAVVSCAGQPALGQSVNTEDLVRQLQPEGPRTRSLRGVTVTPGQQQARPSVDLYINFEFDSARLDGNGLLSLQALGNALKDARLNDYRFEIVGHTDAVGDDAYNQRLSEARAAAVRDHLITRLGVAPQRLTAMGMGRSRLLDSARPTDGINRRVQVTNVGL